MTVLGAAVIFFTGASLYAEKDASFTKAIAALRGKAVPADEATVLPIKIEASARTFREVENEQQAWCNRLLVEPALARISLRSDAPWSETAHDFLRKAPKAVFAEHVTGRPKELALQGRKLVQAGCDDPSVLLFTAFLHMLSEEDLRVVQDCASRALGAWEADPATPAVLLFHANSLLADFANRMGKRQVGIAAEAKALEALGRMGSDKSFLASETDLMLRHFYWAKFWMQYRGAAIRDLAPALALPNWVKLTILGGAEKDLAWQARGNGWAPEVTAERWKGFHEHLVKARAALAQAWKENPKSPYAATTMIAVVMGGEAESGESERLWFDRAIAAQCDYMYAYGALEYAYSPRWSGSHELMLAFGKACLATKRFDLDVPGYFISACAAIVEETNEGLAFYRRPEIARPLIELSEGFLREPSNSGDRPLRLSFLAVNAWMAGDNTRAAFALAQLGAPLSHRAVSKLSDLHSFESDMRKEVAAQIVPILAEFTQAIALYEQEKLVEAEQLFQKIEPLVPGVAGDFVREWLLVIGLERRLATGEWVRFPLIPGLPGWIQRGGDWSGTATGTLVNNGDDLAGVIIHRARVGSEFDIHVEFSINAKENGSPRCDIHFGGRAGVEDACNVAAYGQAGKEAAAASIFNTTGRFKTEETKEIPFQERNELLLRSNAGKLTFVVNGKPAFTDYLPKKFNFGPPDSHIGIASPRWTNATQIKSIQVRRLSASAQKNLQALPHANEVLAK